MDGPTDTIRFLKGKFSEYYRGRQPDFPPRYGKREWAFFLWEGRGMLRHTAFLSKRKLVSFLGLKGPKHVYYSCAYYDRPGAQTMGQKGWRGADLIFDIDADHIKGADKMNYAEQLAAVKKEIVKLVMEYLLGDLAFEERFLSVVFSGGRGYHVHVRDPRVMELNSHERKEIVDYIMGIDIKMERLYNETTFAMTGRGPFMKDQKRIDLPGPDEGGWKGRFSGGVIKFLKELQNMEKAVAIKELQKGKGIGEKSAKGIYHKLFEVAGGKGGLEKVIEQNTLELFDNEKERNAFFNLVINRRKVYAGETDAPVTKDINRLIRLPGSLHGKSSLRVIPLGLDEIEDFEPLRDGVVFGDSPIKVDVRKDTVFEVGGEDFTLKAGETELPEFAAIFMMARGEADIVPKR